MERWHSLIYGLAILHSVYGQYDQKWVLSGDSISLSVDIDEADVTGIAWEKKTDDEKYYLYITEWAGQDIVNLTNVTVGDSGIYGCYYANLESSEADFILLQMFTLLVIERKPNVISLEGLEVNENVEGKARCVIQGDPLPTVDQVSLLMPDGGPISLMPSDSVVYEANFTVEMEFTDITVWNNKSYTCIVSTANGSANKSIDGQVYKTPRLHSPPTVVITDDMLTVSWDAWPDTDIGETGDGPIVKYSVLYNCTNSTSKYIWDGVDGSVTTLDVLISELSIKRGLSCTFFVIPSRPGEGGEGPFITSPGRTVYIPKCLKTPRLHSPPTVVITDDMLTVSWDAWPDTDIGETGDGPIVKYNVLYNCTNSTSKYIGDGVDGSVTTLDVLISELSIKRELSCTFFVIPSRPGKGGEGPFITSPGRTVYIPKCPTPVMSPTNVRVTLNEFDTIFADWERDLLANSMKRAVCRGIREIRCLLHFEGHLKSAEFIVEIH